MYVCTRYLECTGNGLVEVADQRMVADRDWNALTQLLPAPSNAVSRPSTAGKVVWRRQVD